MDPNETADSVQRVINLMLSVAIGDEKWTPPSKLHQSPQPDFKWLYVGTARQYRHNTDY